MSTVDKHAGYNRSKIFLLSVIALITAGVAANIRGLIAGDLQKVFFDPIDKIHSAEMVGAVLGVAFLGFALTIAVGSPLLDYLGMALLLRLSSLCFIAGSATVILATPISDATHIGAYRAIWIGMLLSGIGWGLAETVINPLTATLYPDEKTHRLNVLHAWWPGGLIIGGLAGLALGSLNMGWQVKLAMVFIPALVFGIMTIGTKFPPTERVAAGVPASGMFKELLRPFFLVWWISMFLTAASELAPGQWVEIALTRTVHMHGIWILIYVSGLMFVMRHFAGTVAHKLSPVGLLWFSCLLASVGLVLLSISKSPVTGLLSATVWGTGVCFMWPTMLAEVAERFPRGGALLMGLMGTAGTLSINFVLPAMGAIFDRTKIAIAGGETAFKELGDAQLQDILARAAQVSFRSVAILPAILLLVFGAIWLHDKRHRLKPAKNPAADGQGAPVL
jgi:MFS family permease